MKDIEGVSGRSVLAAWLAGLVLLAATAASAAHVSIDPLFTRAGLHWQFEVALNVQLEPTEDIRAFNVAVHYDPSVVSFADVEIGDPILGNQLELTGPSRFTEYVAQGGCCGYASVTIFDTIEESDSVARALELDAIESSQADQFTLATLRFYADEMETSEIVPQVYGLSGLDGQLLPTTSEGLMLYSEDEVPLGGGSGGGDEVFITTEMPEPQSALLFSVAIAAGAWRARRRRS